jgi:glutathione peroxidase
MSIYNFKFNSIDDEEISLKDFKGKVLLIVNTASKCGFTPQYEGLEELYKNYKNKGLEIIGFPSNQFAEQEPDENKEIKSFCMVNYGVTFPLSEKIEVRGEKADPLFEYLIEKAPFKGFDLSNEKAKNLSSFINAKLPELMDGDSIKWNFTKFLIDRTGNVIGRFEPTVEPSEIQCEIEKLL